MVVVMTEPGGTDRRFYDERMTTFVERLTHVEGQLERCDNKYVRVDSHELQVAGIERRFGDIEKDLADLQGERTWLMRLVLGAVMMAILGVVLVGPLAS